MSKKEKTEYNPENHEHRQRLASEILEMLDYAKFEEKESRGERVFFREVQERVHVMVYTSIVGKEVRDKDEDAIRVCGIYIKKDGTEKGIVKSSRVYRTGEIDKIRNRLLKRMREVWKKTRDKEKCKSCGAPKFTSKKGNLVCCELCYIK